MIVREVKRPGRVILAGPFPFLAVGCWRWATAGDGTVLVNIDNVNIDKNCSFWHWRAGDGGTAARYRERGWPRGMLTTSPILHFHGAVSMCTDGGTWYNGSNDTTQGGKYDTRG